MTPRATFGAWTLLLSLAACTDNDAIGNDREAELDRPAPPAELAPAESLAEIEPGLLKPETMTDADLTSISVAGRPCRFRYTDAGFPVFLYPASGDAPAVIKLNGKLILLPPVGGFQYAAGPVRAAVRHPEGMPAEEAEEAVLILRLAGASDELGFAGVAECE